MATIEKYKDMSDYWEWQGHEQLLKATKTWVIIENYKDMSNYSELLRHE